MRHAEIVLVVEGEDDVKSLLSLLRHHDAKMKEMLDNGTLALDSLAGGSNLAYKLGLIRDALCLSHVLLDNDDAGRKAFAAAKAAGVITDADVNFVLLRGQTDSEFEDMLDTALYELMLTSAFRVSSAHPKFKGKGKWSARLGEAFKTTGKQWNDQVKEEVKGRIAELVVQNPAGALHAARRGPFDALIAGLKQRLDEVAKQRA
jgi:putative ATP-dependent endonuclease of OLD family